MGLVSTKLVADELQRAWTAASQKGDNVINRHSLSKVRWFRPNAYEAK
jgi:hypothetical protein